MRKRKFKVLLGMLVSLLICSSLVACKGVSNEVTVNYDETGYISIDGEKFPLPLKVSDLEKKGYTLDESSLGIGDDNKLSKGVHYNEYILVLKDEKDIGVKCRVINLEEEPKSINECSIYSLKFSNDNSFSLKEEMTVGSNEEELTKVFGEPLDRKENGDFTILKYAYDDNGFLVVEMSKDISITIEYYLEDKEL